MIRRFLNLVLAKRDRANYTRGFEAGATEATNAAAGVIGEAVLAQLKPVRPEDAQVWHVEDDGAVTQRIRLGAVALSQYDCTPEDDGAERTQVRRFVGNAHLGTQK